MPHRTAADMCEAAAPRPGRKSSYRHILFPGLRRGPDHQRPWGRLLDGSLRDPALNLTITQPGDARLMPSRYSETASGDLNQPTICAVDHALVLARRPTLVYPLVLA